MQLDEQRQLVSLVEGRTALYVPREKSQAHAQDIERLWKDVAQEMNRPGDEEDCKMNWSDILFNYCKYVSDKNWPKDWIDRIELSFLYPFFKDIKKEIETRNKPTNRTTQELMTNTENIAQRPKTSSTQLLRTSSSQLPKTNSAQQPTTSSAQLPKTNSAQQTTTSSAQQPSTISVQQPTTSCVQLPTTISVQQPMTSRVQLPSTISVQQPPTSSAQQPSIESNGNQPMSNYDQQPTPEKKRKEEISLECMLRLYNSSITYDLSRLNVDQQLDYLKAVMDFGRKQIKKSEKDPIKKLELK